MNRQIILDTETTGLSVSDGHRIVEIGCIELENQIPTNNKFHCYYAVSAARRDMFHKSLFHPLMWKAILHAKKIGLTIFETGRDETLASNSIQLSDKEKSISFFKSL